MKMKTVSVFFLVALTAFSLACGYSSKTGAPPVAGTTPTITELAPDNVDAGGADLLLTVNGTHFASDAKVNWNGAAQTTTYVSASQLTATIPAAATATAGAASVTVTNPAHAGTGPYGGGGTLAATSTAVDFTIN
jgi:hypothetical protein